VQYGKLLDTAMTILKQKGDIDAYGIVSVEAKRFGTDKTVLANTTQPYISAAVARYQKQLSEADAEQTRRQTALLKKYIVVLNGLVRDLMAKDKLDDAKAAGEVRKSAEALLVDMEKPAVSVVSAITIPSTTNQPAVKAPVEQVVKTAVQEPSPTNEPAAESASIQDQSAVAESSQKVDSALMERKKPTQALSMTATNWQYLSDIKESSVKVGWAQFEKGKSLGALGMKFEGQPIEGGLYAAAPSVIKYNLSQYRFKRLRGRGVLVANGKVTFKIKGSGNKVLWESPEATIGAIKSEPEKFSFDLNITGVSSLSLIVDQVGDNNHFDDSVWMDVQVSK